MKTIEERAQEYIYRNGLMHCGMGYCDAKEAYIEIATEQKKIDIENACINFCVACPTYENCDTRYNCPIYDKFEKAMEE